MYFVFFRDDFLLVVMMKALAVGNVSNALLPNRYVFWTLAM